MIILLGIFDVTWRQSHYSHCRSGYQLYDSAFSDLEPACCYFIIYTWKKYFRYKVKDLFRKCYLFRSQLSKSLLLRWCTPKLLFNEFLWVLCITLWLCVKEQSYRELVCNIQQLHNIFLLKIMHVSLNNPFTIVLFSIKSIQCWFY